MSFRILIVDDEEKIRRMLGNVLKKSGFTVNSAENAQEGVTMAITKSSDLGYGVNRIGQLAQSSGNLVLIRAKTTEWLEKQEEELKRANPDQVFVVTPDSPPKALRDRLKERKAVFLHEPITVPALKRVLSKVTSSGEST